jgi:hypothetical protein
MELTARPYGKPAPRAEKSSVEARTVTVNCAALLSEHELMAQVLLLDAPGGLLCSGKVRDGVRLEIGLAGGDVPDGAPFADHMVRAVVKTSQGRIDVRIEVRLHA